jgi:hypothetical protein
MKEEGRKTLFIDIDGTLLFHSGEINTQSRIPPEILPGVLEKFAEWNTKEYYIILVTARRESERNKTIEQLEKIGIVYDMLITGIGVGDRVIINDKKYGSDKPTAIAICVNRNEGIYSVEL